MRCQRHLSKKKIENMYSKMTTNSQISTTEPKKNKNKNELSNQNRNRFTEMEITWRVVSGERMGGEWGKRYGEQEA